LAQVSEEIAKALDEFRFNDAANICYQFMWHEFCDWYLEMSKPGLYGEDEALKKTSRYMLQQVLMASLRLLHPFMPFITEEIWQRLPDTKGSIMLAPFPNAADFLFDNEASKDMRLIMDLITGVRNIRGEMNISPSKQVDIVVEVPDEKDIRVLRQNMIHFQNLAKVGSMEIEARVSKPEASATAVCGQNQVHVLLKGLLDFKEERRRIQKEMKKVEKEMLASERKLANKGFMDKAPVGIVEGVREKVMSLKNTMDKLTKNLHLFESFHD
jgi:valyl-tRNA synthetase